MAIIKQYHKDTDTTYVYESTSYWDPELKQARSQRKCIGKIDPETGEMIPTGKRGRKNTASEEKNSNEDYSKLLASYEDVKKENLTLNTRIASLEKELSDTSKELNRYRNTLNKVNELIMHAAD
ncbi:MAG: hypothetical protein K5870_11100 [Lachnospiraceae bacterium]|jgi:uncharacterized coiled-coil DUF342 family protein|nr:hypothetical protein [Lachnospiraceae bacterium]